KQPTERIGSLCGLFISKSSVSDLVPEAQADQDQQGEQDTHSHPEKYGERMGRLAAQCRLVRIEGAVAPCCIERFRGCTVHFLRSFLDMTGFPFALSRCSSKPPLRRRAGLHTATGFDNRRNQQAGGSLAARKPSGLLARSALAEARYEPRTQTRGGVCGLAP